MNYSTIRKVVAGSVLTIAGLSAVNAQETTTTSSSSAKVFGGSAQYRTWSLGVNAGVLLPVSFLNEQRDFSGFDANLGYGLTLRKQFGHFWGLELSGLRGKLSGNNDDRPGEPFNSFETNLNYMASLSAVFNLATIDFLRRENFANLYFKAGYSYFAYAPTTTSGTDTGVEGEETDARAIPVGLGLKFKLSNRINFDLGYNLYFADRDGIDGYRMGSNDRFSYGYGGLEISLGSGSKANLDWVNPLAIMYDELKDESLRQEVEALKGRVSELETTTRELSTDSDGDGVSDKFDRSPNTPAGTPVDGSGTPIDFDKFKTGVTDAYGNIGFEFDSSVLRTSSYPALDQVSADLRANSKSKLTIEGHASEEGSEEHNMQLSKDRANSVKTYLVNSGVDSKQIIVKGYGETRPLVSNDTEEGRMQNRRVEFKR